MDAFTVQPEGPLEGVTVWNSVFPTDYSAVFLEAIRDKWMENALSGSFQSYQDRQDMVVAHEIGHEPGHKDESVVHDEPGLMSNEDQTEEFSAQSLFRIRRTSSWRKSW